MFSRSIPEPNSGCLLWEGSTVRQRRGKNQIYGNVRLNGKMVKTHRVAYEAAYGAIPVGAHVLHRCDVGLCCNPKHLFLGDNSTNVADKVAKDRGKKKLSHAKAMEIHAMRKNGMAQKRIGKLMGVDPSTVSRILAGKRRPAALPAAA